MKKCFLSAIAGALAMLVAIIIAAKIGIAQEQTQRNMSTLIMYPILYKA